MRRHSAVLFSALVLAMSGGAAVAAGKGAPASNGGGAASGNGGGNSSGGNGNSGGGGAPPAALPLCKLSDLGGGATACSGFFQGNLLNNSAADLDAQAAGLSIIGLADWNGQIAEPQLSLSGLTVDFSTLLYGVSFVGIHWGAGANSPSPHTPGGVTAFYRFDAGEGLDAFSLAFSSASGARLYLTQSPPPPLPAPTPPKPADTIDPPHIVDEIRGAVPEPATWALMILGFGAAGAMLRRRRAAPAV